MTLRLLLLGMPLSLILGALTAVALLPVLPWWEAVCLSAIVAPTEVALIEGLLEDRRIPEQVRHALSVESGVERRLRPGGPVGCDGVGLGARRSDRGQWAWFAFSTEIVSLIIGAAVGLVGGALVSWSRHRGWMSDTWAQLATLALAFICLELGERLHASGFVAAFTGGLAFAFVSRRHSEARYRHSSPTPPGSYSS